MHYFKGIGILILGFVSGAISAGFFVEDSLTKIETANNEIQQVMFNAVESASEIDLIEARGKLEAVKALLAAYKDSSDLSAPIAKELDSIKVALKKDEQYLKNMNERVQRLHMDLQKDFEIVLSDYEFYIEPL
jgi:DNA repair ATPase RecN